MTGPESSNSRALVALGATAVVGTGIALGLHALSRSSPGGAAARPKCFSVVVFLIDGEDAKPVGKTIRLPRHASVADLLASAAQALRQDTVR